MTRSEDRDRRRPPPRTRTTFRSRLMDRLSTRAWGLSSLPREEADTMFDILVDWGRFGELFAYREDTDSLTVA